MAVAPAAFHSRGQAARRLLRCSIAGGQGLAGKRKCGAQAGIGGARIGKCRAAEVPMVRSAGEAGRYKGSGAAVQHCRPEVFRSSP